VHNTYIHYITFHYITLRYSTFHYITLHSYRHKIICKRRTHTHWQCKSYIFCL